MNPLTGHARPKRGFRARGLPLWAHVADVLTIALLLLGLYVAIEGGFVLWSSSGQVRASVKSAWRVFAWAGAIWLVRALLVRQHPLHRRIIDPVAAAARAAGPLRDDLALFGLTPPASTPGRARPWRGALGAAGVILFYAMCTGAMTYPQMRVMDRGISGDIGDPLLSTWRLAWIARQLPHDPLHLFDANIFHPERLTLAYSDAMLVPSLMAAPLVWLGMHQLFAYNLLFLAGWALSGAAMFVLVRSLTRHTGAALLSGFVFAFLPYRFVHYAHLELQMAMWIPLCLWSFHRTVEHGRLRDGLLTGLFFALQTLSSWYYGIFFATYLLPVCGAVLIAAGRDRARRCARPLAAGAVLAAILIVPYTVPYLLARHAVGERELHEIVHYSALPWNYLAAPSVNRAFGGITSGLGGPERNLFMGITVPLLALVAVWPPMSAVRIAYAVGGVLAFDISLGYNGVLYPLLHAVAFPYHALRVPARMAILVGFSLAVLAGFGAVRISARLRHTRTAALALSLLAAAIYLEYRSAVPLRRMWTVPPPVYEVFRTQPSAIIVELPLVEPDITLEPIYMYHSTFYWHRLVNGYSGFGPDSYFHLRGVMADFPDDRSIAELRRRGVEYVIVHGAFMKPAVQETLGEKLQQRPELALVGRYRWEQRETELYRLLDSARPRQH